MAWVAKSSRQILETAQKKTTDSGQPKKPENLCGSDQASFYDPGRDPSTPRGGGSDPKRSLVRRLINITHKPHGWVWTWADTIGEHWCTDGGVFETKQGLGKTSRFPIKNEINDPGGGIWKTWILKRFPNDYFFCEWRTVLMNRSKMLTHTRPPSCLTVSLSKTQPVSGSHRS